jgi:hypothetical protein
MQLMDEQSWFKKQIELDTFYRDIQNLFTQYGDPVIFLDGRVIPNGIFWPALVNKIIEKGIEYSATPTQNQCSNKKEEATEYSGLHNETNMLMLGLIVLSWLAINIKKKTEDGHCHNSIHKQTKDDRPFCTIGSNFHKKLYEDYIRILEDFLPKVRASIPIPPRSD